MYSRSDPRFRRRLNDLSQNLERANESTQTNLYLFNQNYIVPCLTSVTECFTICIEASCPSLNLTATQRQHLRRQNQRNRVGGRGGRAEASFDFYDDWDNEYEETDALMGWGNEEFDRLLAGSNTSVGGYGTTGAPEGRGNVIASQPKGKGRSGMSYPKGRRKSAHSLTTAGANDPTVIPSSSLFGRLFGVRAQQLRYKPSAADLQDHPTARAGLTEGEALLGKTPRRGHRRLRSATEASERTVDSLSSRGDIFPSDEEFDDAIPLDDEFAVVLERRGGGGETESSSARTGSGKSARRKRERGDGKRPSAGSRKSTLSSRDSGDRPSASEEEEGEGIPEIKSDGALDATRIEIEVEAFEDAGQKEVGLHSPREAHTPILHPTIRHDEPSAMTTPLALTDDEDGGDVELKIPARSDSKT